jgi:hypothetical protein
VILHQLKHDHCISYAWKHFAVFSGRSTTSCASYKAQ